MGRHTNFKPYKDMQTADGRGQLVSPGGVPIVRGADAIDRFSRIVNVGDSVIMPGHAEGGIVWTVTAITPIRHPGVPGGVAMQLQVVATVPVMIVPDQPAAMLIKVAEALDASTTETPASAPETPPSSQVG